MKPTTVVSVVIVAIALLFAFSWGYANKGTATPAAPRATGAAGTLTAATTSYDFGTISMKDGDVMKEFTITNTGDTETTMRTLVTSCMCTTAFVVAPDGNEKGPFGMPGHGGSVPPANETIEAGGSRTIRVVFDPNAHGPAGIGRIDRVVTMTDASGGTLELRIAATVTP